MPVDLKKMYHTIRGDHFPPRLEIAFIDADDRRTTLAYEKVVWEIDGEARGLRYGENPDQEAALYKLINGNLTLGEVSLIAPGRYLVTDAELLQFGKHPGKINLTDADNALNILRFLTDRPAAAIMKHNNPSGVAVADTLVEAYLKADLADHVAAFGGCIALNRPIDRDTAQAISERYAEVVVAPDFEESAVGILAQRKNLRIMRIGNLARLQSFAAERFVDFKSLLDGGLIAQVSYLPKARCAADLQPAETTYKGQLYRVNRAPDEREIADLLFGWVVEAGVTSNSVLYVKDGVTVGIGTGEQDRVGVAEIARDKAYRKLCDRLAFERHGVNFSALADDAKGFAIQEEVNAHRGGLPGSVMVSDAFFPFRDGIEVGLREGVSAVIQPGGSLNDYQSIEACNEYGAAMVFTGQRSFKH
ncbi:MAG: IMP cyclohydrolase [Myxococcales bacterium]|nr:IMP cyclohydrolase [Myxococcales bacterium]